MSEEIAYMLATINRRLATLERQETPEFQQIVSKSVSHNTNTDIADVTIGNSGSPIARYLVTLTGASTNTLFADTYLVSQEYNEATVTRLGALAEFSSRTTSVALTAAADAANRKITLTVNQQNTFSEATTVRMTLQVLGVASGAPVTVAAV